MVTVNSVLGLVFSSGFTLLSVTRHFPFAIVSRGCKHPVCPSVFRANYFNILLKTRLSAAGHPTIRHTSRHGEQCRF